ncbi:MAG TPA: caspase family protein, partial [Cyclobacteriaceae bacterium]|nr:caspase family protein [Cyclobacteriaceae bacterium]
MKIALAILIFFFVNTFNAISQGCTNGDCVNGTGTYVYNDGTKYIGTFKDSKADGHGVCYFANGTTFIGEWANHQATGYGTWYYQDGSKQTGHYKDNVFIDHALLTAGCLSGDCNNGFGTYLWDGGTLYVGQFKNYKLDGLGTCYFNEGSKYVGEWLNDKFNGFGTNYVRDGSIQKGQWKDHQFLGEEQTLNCVSGDCDNGFGIYKYGEKGTYIGEFKESYREGYGTYYFPTGDKYVGMWKRGNFDGQGTYTYASGTVNSGLWKEHKLVSEVTADKLKAEINWDEPLAATSSSSYNQVTIKACIKSSTDVKRITVLLNGKTFSTETSVKADPVSGCTVSFSRTLSLAGGENHVVIDVENEGGLSQSTERVINYIAASKQKRLALVIGNAAYQFTTPLKNPVNDASSMAHTLELQGFKVIKIENATGKEMKMAIDNFGR